VFLFLANIAIFLLLKICGYLYKRKKGWNFNFFATKWTWMDEDGAKDVMGRFGFTNLNPRGFVIVAEMQ
jgi:hypothetical protein